MLKEDQFEQLAKDIQMQLDKLNEIMSHYSGLTFRIMEIRDGGRVDFSVHGHLHIASIGYSYDYIHDHNKNYI